MPSLMALSSVWSVLTPTSLFPVSVSYCLGKTLEYSIRGILVEMVFVTLDYESVFFGKEIIGLFANRLGKGVMAIVLAGVMSVAAKRHGIDHLNQLIVAISFTWFFVSLRMTRLLNQHQQKQQEQDEFDTPLDKSFTD
jgi:ATP/ADP translocase